MEENSAPQKVEKIITAHCRNCGGNMVYSPEKGMLHCEHCNSTRDLPRASDLVVERSFNEGLTLLDGKTGFGVETKVFHCQSCGSETSVDKETVSFRCPFCGSEKVDQQAQQLRVIEPSGLLPFKITQKNATEQFREWIRTGWFRPNDLKKFAELGKIQGVYIPFWTYDASTESSWTAEAGYYYYVTETYRDSNGQMQTREVRHIRWVPVSGFHADTFDDVLVVASNGLRQDIAEEVFPFQLNEVINFDPHYILGLNSEVYQKDLKEGFAVADQIMDDHIQSAIVQQIPGDTHRSLNVNTHKFNITFKHILLPVWIAGYRYNNKVFQYVVNGQTGKAGGTKPLSFWKIFFFVLFLLVIAGGIFWLSQKNR